MSSKHTINLTVLIDMDEMDGTPEQSAEIARDIVYGLIADHWDADADVIISETYEATA